MTFQNPLHRLSLHDGARTLTLAMGDWAILQVDSSGQVLPIWILNHIHDDIIATHQFTPQNKFQLFDCFKNTAMWHGFLYSLSCETERRFLADHLEETSVNLQQSTFPSSVTFSYPYQHSQCWHHPSDHERLAHVDWVVERMMSLPYDDAMRFMENLTVMCLRMEIKLRRAIRAQHGIAVDRFAREIVGFLKVVVGALATTECQSVRRA